MTIRSVSFIQEVENTYNELNDLETQLNTPGSLPPEAIAEKISFLEKSRFELLSMNKTLTVKKEICELNGKDPKENEMLGKLQEKLDKIPEIWQRCHSTCTEMQKKINAELARIKANLMSEESQNKPLVELPSFGNLDYLPFELLLQILSKLSPEDLLTLMQVNKDFQNPQMWKALALKTKEECQQHIKNNILIDNINKGLYTTQKLATESRCLCINGNILYSATYEGEIEFWDLTTMKRSDVLKKTHPYNFINYLYFDKEQNLLYSCSHNSAKDTIKIWDPMTKECKVILEGHETMVNCLFRKGDFLYSGSDDCTIKVWDLKTNQCVKTLGNSQFINGFVYALYVEGNFLYSGSFDKKIRIWNLTTGECEHILEHQSSVNSICIKGNFLYSGSRDGTIKIWDLRNKQCINTFEGHQSAIMSLCINENLLYSSSWGNNHRIKIWDLETNQCAATLKGKPDSLRNGNFVKEGNVLYAVGDPITVCDFGSPLTRLLEAAKDIQEKDDDKLFSSFSNECRDIIQNEVNILKLKNISFGNELQAQAIYRYVLKEILSLFAKGQRRAELALFNQLPDEIKTAILDGAQPKTNEEYKQAILNYLYPKSE
jgi:WD40 repeat protein